MNHPGTPIRPPASAFLLLDSEDRDQRSTFDPIFVNPAQWPQPLNDFVIQKRQPFVTGYFHRIGATEFRMEFNSPNVNERNNKIELAVPAGDPSVTITVPEGFYTPVELAAALETVIVAAFPGEFFEVTYDDTKASFKIDNPGGQEFQLLPYEYSTPQQTQRGLYFLMNWGDGVSYWPDSTSTQQWGLPNPSMCYTRYIDVCSSKLTQYQLVKDNSTRESQSPTVVLRVYLGNYTSEGVGDGDTSATLSWPGCRPCVIHRLYTTPKYSMWSPGQYIDNIDLQLRDDAGNLLLVPGDNIDAGDDLFNYASNSYQLTVHCSET